MNPFEKARNKGEKISIGIWLAVIFSMFFGLIWGALWNLPIWLVRAWGSFVLGYELTASWMGGVPLSPVMQWIDNQGAEDAPWWKGPRIIVFGVAGMMAYCYAYMVGYWDSQPFNAPWWVYPLAAVVLASVYGFNAYHWARPQRYDA